MRLHATAVLLSLLLLLCGGAAEAFLFGKVDENDLYGVLGVSRGASKGEIKKAFRALTREHHPDLQETLEAKEAAKDYMVKLLRAYEVLSDDVKRQDYDSFGKIPGERLDASDLSAEEIFERYHQHSPILSKTIQLESVTMLRRILSFRGNRLFLVQMYDDTCRSCRWFSSTWDTFAQSSLTQGGVVEMLRIDANSPEGPALIELLGASYSGQVRVVGVVDGKLWSMHQLEQAITSKSGRLAHNALHDFAMGFLHERSLEVSSLRDTDDAESILAWLREPRGPGDGVRILVPPLAVESIPLTLSMLHDGAASVRAVPRAPLLHIVEEYCGTPVEVRGRDGELVPMPEFIVVSKEPLADGPAGTGGCRGIEIGASAAMTYKKAAAFALENLPPRHSDMAGLPYLTAMAFHDVCRRHCLMWLRGNCQEEASPELLQALQGDYRPFKLGYVCFNEEPALRRAMPEDVAEGNFLAAIVDAADDKPHFIFGSDHATIANALSTLLTEAHEAAPLYVPVPISTLLGTKSFPMMWKQRAFLCLMWLLSFVAPFWTNSYPFLMMYITHRVMKRFNVAGLGDAAESNNTNNSNNGAAPTPSNTPAATSTSRPLGQANNSNSKKGNAIPTLSPSDLEAAKSGRGFLLLIAPSDSEQPTLPAVAHERPFSPRLIPEGDEVWRPWIAEQLQASGAESDAKALCLVAVRQGKMTAAVKPPSASLETWLLDLTDGTVTTSAQIPAL